MVGCSEAPTLRLLGAFYMEWWVSLSLYPPYARYRRNNILVLQSSILKLKVDLLGTLQQITYAELIGFQNLSGF